MGILDVERQVGNSQLFPFANNEAALYHIAEFTDVPFPRLQFKRSEKFGSNLGYRTGQLHGEVLHESLCQQADVPRTLTQRRQVHLEHRKAIEQIFTETPFGYLFRQIAVGCRNDTHVDACRLGIAYLDIFARFEDAQQLRLQFKGHLTDFIQEDSPVVRFLKKPFLIFQRPRKRTCLVPEHLALQQFLAERGTVHRNEILPCTLATVMDGLRKHLLACSRLSGQQYRYIGHRHFLRQRHSIFQRFGLSQDRIERVRLPHLLLKLFKTGIHRGLLYRTADEGNNLVIVISFGDIVESPVLDGLYAIGNIAVSRQENDLHIRRSFLDSQHQVHPVPVGQKNITQSYIGTL